MTSYYIDTCILNLWQKEVGFSGVRYWEIAEKLFEFIEEKGIVICYSGSNSKG